MRLSGPGEPPACIWMLCNIASLDRFALGGVIKFSEERNIAYEGHARAAGGWLIAPNGNRGRMGGRVEDVLAVPRDREKQESE